MLGDVLLINAGHTKAAQQIVERLNTIQSDKIIVAIGGESGTGKSELAHVVARLLKDQGEPAKLLHIDDYYQTSPQERGAWRKEHGIESIGYTEYDWDEINRTLVEFRAGANAVVKPCIDLLTDQEDRLLTSFAGLKYMVIEGLYAIQADADVRVLIDLTYHETKKAQLVRGKETLNAERLQVLEREHQVVQSLRPLANLLVTPDFDVVEA